MTAQMQSQPVNSCPYPANQVIAIIDDPENVASALSQLGRRGFEGGDIAVLSGMEGAHWLGTVQPEQGLWARMRRILRGRHDTVRETLSRQVDELRAGHILVGVHVRNASERTFAGRILKRCNGHFINFFGPWTISGIAP